MCVQVLFYNMKCNRVFRMQNGKLPLSIESGGWDALESGKNVRNRDSGRGPSMCKGTVGRRGLLALRHESVFCMANSGWPLCGREAAQGEEWRALDPTQCVLSLSCT